MSDFYLLESIFGCGQPHVVLTGRNYQFVKVSVGSTQTFIQIVVAEEVLNS